MFKKFDYIKEWKKLKWFYDNSLRIFVWIWDNGITTIINNVKVNYINNLKNTIK